MRTGRPAGIGRREALLAAAPLHVVADDEVALHHVHLFPVIVDERHGRKRTRLDLQEPRAAALLVRLVEIGGEDLLVEARRIARRHFPAGLQVDLHELEMLLRFHHAPSSLPASQGARYTSSCAMAWCPTVPSKRGNRLKSSRASARSRDANAAFIAASSSNSSCAISTALPGFTGKGSCQASGVCSTMRRRPGQRETSGTWTSRERLMNPSTSAGSISYRTK